MSIADSLPYRSPVSRLLPFPRKSRNRWKAKCQAANRGNKSLETRLVEMRESRDRWKAKARALKDRLLGSSEVLESIIGKFKNLAGERGRHGLTGMVLSIGALVGKLVSAGTTLRLDIVGDTSLATPYPSCVYYDSEW